MAGPVAVVLLEDRDGTTRSRGRLVSTPVLRRRDGPPLAGRGLAEKSRIREFIARIGETELRAALHFAVLAVVVLPLLPTGPFGPGGGIRPRELWTVSPDLFGRDGRPTGVVDSRDPELFPPESRHARLRVGPRARGDRRVHCLLPRVLTVTLVLSPAVAGHLVPYVIAPAVVGGCFLAYALLRKLPSPAHGEGRDAGNPLRLGAAFRWRSPSRWCCSPCRPRSISGAKAGYLAPRPCWDLPIWMR